MTLSVLSLVLCWLALLLLMLTPQPGSFISLSSVDQSPSESQTSLEAMGVVKLAGGSKTGRRSASSQPSRDRAPAAANASEFLWLRFEDATSPVAVAIDDHGMVRIQGDVNKTRSTAGIAMNIRMVLDASTGKPLLSRGENETSETDSYSFLIRSHHRRRYICMNTTADIYTYEMLHNQMPIDCLWRGQLLSQLASPEAVTTKSGNSTTGPKPAVARMTFYHAFYPEGSRTANRRWYFGFSSGYRTPRKGYRLHGRTPEVEFHVQQLQSNARQDSLDVPPLPPADANATEPALMSLGSPDRLISLEAGTLNEATRRRIAVHSGGTEGCRAARTAAERHARELAARDGRIIGQLRLLRRRLRERASPEAERLARRFFRDLPLKLIDDSVAALSRRLRRKLCRLDLLTVAFESARAADKLALPLCHAAAAADGAQRRRAQRHRRRKTRLNLLRLLDRRRGGVLTALRDSLNVTLPSQEAIAAVLLRRRAFSAERRPLRRLEGAEREAAEAALRRSQLADSVQFAVAVVEAKPGRLLGESSGQHGGLLTRERLMQLKVQWKNFLRFYNYIDCENAADA